ncbi:hypothetical protein BGW42_005707 [Actinomortierella wolfii]|nr:hypothetical protein BGW42_005707 [Actinomortierella wolfii]
MSSADYWKSNAKYWCKFCKIYITDNKVTRKTHDAGTKHKENVERFLRDQDQRSRDKLAEEAKLKKEMEAIEKAAQLQYQRDVEAGLIAPPPGGFPPATRTSASTAVPPASAAKESSTSSSTSTPTPTSPKTASTSDKKALASKDQPSSPKQAVEVRDETIGQPGQWQTVETPSNKRTRAKAEEQDDATATKNQGREGPRLSSSIQGADLDDEEGDPEDLREFKIVERTWPNEKPSMENEDEEEGGGGGSMFKKRKGNAGKTRNIRKKT